MKSDDHSRAKSDLLRELESLRAQLDDPDAAELNEEDIPLLLDKVEKVVSAEPDGLAEDGLEPEEIAALQAAYRDATTDLESRESRLVEDAFQRLKEERKAIDSVMDDAQQSVSNLNATQQPLFEDSEDTTESSTDSAPVPPGRVPGAERPSTATGAPPSVARPAALGDNPFLPRHIRERLQERRQILENDIAQAASFFPAGRRDQRDSQTNTLNPDHQALVDELVAEYLPRIEADLRRRLMHRLNKMNAADPSGPTDE